MPQGLDLAVLLGYGAPLSMRFESDRKNQKPSIRRRQVPEGMSSLDFE